MRKQIEVCAVTKNDAFDSVMQHMRVALSPQAQFAMDMIRSGMMMPIKPSGRNNRLMAPNEIVKRAVAITTLAFDQFDQLGWTAEQPALNELISKMDKPGF